MKATPTLPNWAEVQFVAWVLDGGVVLLSLYLIALATAVCRLIWSSFSNHSMQLRQWGAVLVDALRRGQSLFSSATVPSILRWASNSGC